LPNREVGIGVEPIRTKEENGENKNKLPGANRVKMKKWNVRASGLNSAGWENGKKPGGDRAKSNTFVGSVKA